MSNKTPPESYQAPLQTVVQLQNITVQSPNKSLVTSKKKLQSKDEKISEVNTVNNAIKIKQVCSELAKKKQTVKKLHKNNEEVQSEKISSSSNKIKNSINKQEQQKNKSMLAPPQSAGQQTFYEETYYVTAFRQNYLILISESMQVIEFPVGVLRGSVAIGDPIRLKLQYDCKRAESDRRKFNTMQEQLLRQYGDKD